MTAKQIAGAALRWASDKARTYAQKLDPIDEQTITLHGCSDKPLWQSLRMVSDSLYEQSHDDHNC